MNLIWLTDIHLNFLGIEERLRFYQEIKRASGNGILISGDIAEATSVTSILTKMAKTVNKPIYFVLGNHDYYHSSINKLRKEMSRLTKKEPLLHWLPTSGPQNIGNKTILLGEDCWADGRYGNYTNSKVRLNDSRMILELYQSNIIGKYQLLNTMQQLADSDANHLKSQLLKSINTYHPKKIVILTHVPPFREACMYEGEKTGTNFLPFFSSKVIGDLLLKIAKENKEINFLVLCGHTHSKAYFQPRDNLTIKAGHAEYKRPEIQEIITI